MKENQNNMVVDYINTFGSINPIQALADLGIMRLASRISDLKKMGYPIAKKMITGKNRYGDNIYYAEYSMEEESNECK